MRVILGYGNSLRGEDGFGVDVITELEKFDLPQTKLISVFQLTPEIVLELLCADEIVFVDACFSQTDNYSLACAINRQNGFNLTHHISPKMVMEMLNSLYKKYPKFQIHSMLSSNFDFIENEKKYMTNVRKVANYLFCDKYKAI